MPCHVQQEFLVCTAEIRSGASDFNLHLPSSSAYSSSSNYYNYYDGIIWSNGNNQNTEVYSNNNLNLNLEVNSFNYNSESKYYEFTFQDTTYTSGKTFFVTDIIIGGTTTYAYCTYENNYFKCKTSRIDNYNPSDEIKISSTKTYGNVDWNNVSGETKISNLYFVEISHIYNLEFTSGKWQFTVESNNELSSTSEEGLTLDILIDGVPGHANCVKTQAKLLKCEVDSTGLTQNSLIKLNYNVDGDIKFLNLEDLHIPINVELEFNKIYDLSYNNYYSTWNFGIEARIDDGKEIPNDSYITVDIKYDNTNDIAICTKTSIVNNILTLSCRGKNEIPQSSMISLSQEKTPYSSITWREAISENLDIFISANLYVETMDNIIFDTNSQKWSFDMNTDGYNYNYPLNSKVKIDILYNGVETTATCTYVSISEYKFSCAPDVESQNQVDTFEIINKGVNKQGTVTYSNPNQKLTLLYSAQLKFEFAYDLLYSDSKWNFKIKVSESNLSNGKTTLLYFKNYYDHKTALCLMGENNILSCESYTNSYYYSDESVYLTSYQNNKYVQWTNSFSDTPIYVNLNIRVISVSGIFANNVWKFVIKYENIGENEKNYYYDNHALLDILVNNEQSTALCTISYNNYLKCESNHNYQSINDIIKLPEESEPISGTIYLAEELTEEQKIIKPTELTININYIEDKYYSGGKLKFSISSYIEGEVSNGFTEIEILINNTNNEISTSRAICEIKNNYEYYIVLVCTSINDVSSHDLTKIKVDSSGYSKLVKIIYNDIQDLNINTDRNIYYNPNNEYNYCEDNNCDEENDTNIVGEEKNREDNVDNSTDIPTDKLDKKDNKAYIILICAICGFTGVTLLILGIVLYKLLKSRKTVSKVASSGENIGNNLPNLNENNNVNIYERKRQDLGDSVSVKDKSSRPINIQRRNSKKRSKH